MASHFVSYFTKNENPEQRFVTQREKRWKYNRKSIAITLAQLHNQELDKVKKNKKLSKRNIQESPIESKFHTNIRNIFVMIAYLEFF